MGTARKFDPVKLFCGIIHPPLLDLTPVTAALEDRFGEIHLASDPIPFDFTRYYQAEMGPGLVRKFVAFRQLITPEQLPPIKEFTNQLENRFLEEGQRTVNLDPGTLSDATVILATTKNYYHRIPLSAGIYAHMEYIIAKGNRIGLLDWTYPDYRSKEYLDFFQSLLLAYKAQMKQYRQFARGGRGPQTPPVEE